MSDKPPKLIVPNDPVQIGTTADGQPIHLDLRELIPTPDEHAERWAKTLDGRRAKLINDVALLVLKNAALFIEQTFWNTANQTGKRLYESGNAEAAFAWANSNGYEAIQDGLRTVVKHNGKVIRDMHANISESLAPAVAEQVSKIIKKVPMPK
jgi:hypothetical protein